VIARRLKAEGRSKKVSQAALLAMAPDGAILAMVGGRDYNESQFNRATQAKRQPGSLFKLFDYLTAFENGFTPRSVMIDRPVQIGKWEPENYGRRFHGEVTLRSAFAQSLNSVAVQLVENVGIRKVIETAHRLGVQSELPALPSLALGSAEVTLIEMTRAFGAIAANAESVEPYAIDSISRGDQVVFARQQSVLTPARNQAARLGIVELLASVVREGTGRAARLSVPTAGKTGTSQDSRDAWFIGFAPDVVVGVWVGNDDNSPTRNVVGGDMPARIWNEFVKEALPARTKSARARLITYAQPATAATNGAASPVSVSPTQPRARQRFAACRASTPPGSSRSKAGRSGSMESKASAAKARASCGAILVGAMSSASRSEHAMNIAVRWTARISRAWSCSTAVAALRRMRRRICSASSSRRAPHTLASGARMTTMTEDQRRDSWCR
jgi:penicillin-binding protein 1A